MTPVAGRIAAIDWAALQRRLAAAAQAAAGIGPDAGSPAARTLLDARARLLARPVATEPLGRIEVLVQDSAVLR